MWERTDNQAHPMQATALAAQGLRQACTKQQFLIVQLLTNVENPYNYTLLKGFYFLPLL